MALSLGVWLIAAVASGAEVELPVSIAQNWHQWRGPLATGVAPLANPPITWDENTNVQWKVRIPGDSTATPIVWGDQIFLTTAIMTDREIELPPPPADPPENPFNIQRPKNFYRFVVMCVDRRTGETRWQHMAKEEVPHEGHHPHASFAMSSPMTDGKHLYVNFGSRGVYCYDLAGNQKWGRDLGKMHVYNYFGEGSAPVVHGDSLVVNRDHEGGSFITVLDAHTGESRWKVDRDENTSWATPLVVDHNGRTQVIVSGTNRVRSYDSKTGEVIWECGGQVLQCIPCPVTDGRLVFVMTGYTGNALYAIPLDSSGDITDTDKIAWKRNEPGTPYVPSPLLYGELLCFTGSINGIYSCLDATTGTPIIDRKRVEGISNIYASPVAAADHIYLTNRDGTTVVVKRNTEFEILATNKLDDRFDASAAIVGNQILLRGKEFLYCIAAE
ncbi:MAG: hypothetical protein EXS05_01895 [Planctomycetaceae bacterium]|nr:hypothetical protein [Planctomycetaceae bacterium]